MLAAANCWRYRGFAWRDEALRYGCYTAWAGRGAVLCRSVQLALDNTEMPRKGRFRGLGSGEQYLRDYPDLKRWMNQCVACQSRGYRPDLPENIYDRPNAAAGNLRSFFQPLPLDALGRCHTCAMVLDAGDGSE
jgi:hypothetical protein